MHWARAHGHVREARRSWPAGATAGVLLVVVACAAVAFTYSKMARQRELYDQSVQAPPPPIARR